MIESFKWDNHPSIIAASKCVISDGSMVHRVVLRKTGDNQYVTHQENLRLDGDTWKHRDFYWGHYFDSPNHLETNLDKARADYAERCAKL